MPVDGPIPGNVFTLVAAATIFAVMFDLGLKIARERGRVGGAAASGSLLKGLFAVLVAVPAMAVVVTDAFGLPRAAMVGIVLMALSPGAPVALRRSLEAGGEESFAPILQIAVAALAVVTMPLSIAALNEYYAGQAVISPRELARQVFFAQFLPLGLGVLARRLLPGRRRARSPGSRRGDDAPARPRGPGDRERLARGHRGGASGRLGVVLMTLLALAVGHAMGGPHPQTRTAVAISSAVRNPGLALVVATVNDAHATVTATMVAYLVIAAFTVMPYVVWRRRPPPARACPPSARR